MRKILSSSHILLFLIVLLPYLPALWHPFSDIDDLVYVTRNLVVKNGLTSEGIKWAFTTLYFGNWCPVTWTSHMLDIEIFGMWAGGHHLVSILLHAFTALFLFHFFLTTTGSLSRSFVLALLFGLHPVHVEAVVWISSRKDVLAGFFLSLVLLSHLRYTEKPGIGRYLTTLILFFLGLCSKGSLVPFALILLLLDIWPLKRVNPAQLSSSGQILRHLLMEKAPFILLALSFAGITAYAQHQMGAMEGLWQPPPAIGLGNGIYNALSSICRILWPFNKLGFPYPVYTAPLSIMILSSVFLILVTLLTVNRGSVYPSLPVGWFWFILGTMPFLQIIQIGLQPAADRWMHLPSLGIFIMLVWAPFPSEIKVPWSVVKMLSAILLSSLAAACLFQVHLWRDSLFILRHTISRTRDNPIAHRYLSAILKKRGLEDEALEEAVKSVRLLPVAPSFSDLLSILQQKGDASKVTEHLNLKEFPNRAFSLTNQARTLLLIAENSEANTSYSAKFSKDATAEALNLGEESLSITPASASYSVVSLALLKMGRIDDAEKILLQAITQFPISADFAITLSVVYFRKGDLKNALSFNLEAVKIDPNSHRARRNLSSLYLTTGRKEAALSEAEKAVEITDEVPANFIALGDALYSLNRFSGAETAYAKALSLSPRSDMAFNGRGAALFAMGDLDGARDAFSRSLNIRPDAAVPLLNLGAVLLKQGKRLEAEEALKRAVRLDPKLRPVTDSLPARDNVL